MTLPPDLVQRARLVLAQLEMTSCGTTCSYDSSGGDSDGFLPESGDPNPPHLRYRILILEAGDNEDQVRTLVRRAGDELEDITRRTRPVTHIESRDELHTRIVKDGSGWSVHDVSCSMRCLEHEVIVARKAANRDPATGYPLALPADAAPLERRQRARELREQGYRVQSIALILKVDKATISRDLRAA